MTSIKRVPLDSNRVLIESLDREFSQLHERTRELTSQTALDVLYINRSGQAFRSIGENILRSAAAVEQTSGGLLSNLWDDPFEWTLPETLSTLERVLEYLGEVETTRKKAFARFVSDTELFKQVSLPSGEFQPLLTILVETLARSAEYERRAVAASNAFPRDDL